MTTEQRMTIGRTVGQRVSEIMTPWSALLTIDEQRLDDQDVLREAEALGITYVPIVAREGVVGLLQVERGVPPIRTQLSSDWFVVADTWVLELLDLFATIPDRVFLVMGSRRVAGMVAPADLNKVPARASVYLLTASIERALADLIRKHVGDDEAALANYLTSNRINKLRQQQAVTKPGDLELPLLHYAYLEDLVTILSKHQVLRRKLGYSSRKAVEEEFDFRQVRNAVSHLTGSLVVSRKDIATVNDTCEKLINLGQKIAGL